MRLVVFKTGFFFYSDVSAQPHNKSASLFYNYLMIEIKTFCPQSLFYAVPFYPQHIENKTIFKRPEQTYGCSNGISNQINPTSE
jgi:hypothetical protein